MEKGMPDRRRTRFWAVVMLCLIFPAMTAGLLLSVAPRLGIRVRTNQSLVQAGPLLRLFSEQGSSDAIEAVLKAHPEWINADCGNGTPLYVACGQGRADLVHYLLTHGADPNLTLTQSKNKETAIVPAVEGRHLEIVKDLLAHGADPTVKDVYGRSLLWLAREDKWPEGEKLLEAAPKRQGEHQRITTGAANH